MNCWQRIAGGLGLRIWLPDNEAQALYKSTVIAAVHTDKLVAARNAEMLPSHVLLLHGIVVELVPQLVDQEVTCIIDKSETLYVATLAILADINVRKAALRINLKILVVLLSSLDGTHIRT